MAPFNRHRGPVIRAVMIMIVATALLLVFLAFVLGVELSR